MNPYISITQSTIIEILPYLPFLLPFLLFSLSILNQILNMSLDNMVLRNSFSGLPWGQEVRNTHAMRGHELDPLVWEDPPARAAKPGATTTEAWVF